MSNTKVVEAAMFVHLHQQTLNHEFKMHITVLCKTPKTVISKGRMTLESEVRVVVCSLRRRKHESMAVVPGSVAVVASLYLFLAVRIFRGIVL